jgi:hypothetical protein
MQRTVLRYCRPILDQGDFAVWPAFSNTGKSSPCRGEKSSLIMVSDRTIGNNALLRNDPCHRRFT